MADKYDKNGYNSSDFKRNSKLDNMKSDHDEHHHHHQQDGDEDMRINKKAGEYMKELLGEKIMLNHTKFPLSSSLIDQEVTRVQTSGRAPPRDNKYLDVYREKPLKLSVKVLVPVKEHPKFNFIGKLMGPKGSTMKNLQEETMCKMAVLGRGSMRDRQKEEELRNSLDPKYSHLSDELHVEVSALAPPAEAHARIAYALAEVKKYMTPDSEPMWQPHGQGLMKMMDRDTGHVQRPPLVGSGPKGGKRPQMYNSQAGPSHPPYQSHPQHQQPAPRPAPRMQQAPPLRAMQPPKPNKVLSILDRARSAMETSYGGYEESYAQPEPQQQTYNEEYSSKSRGPRGAPDSEFYYDRGPERFYDDEYYGKEDTRDYETATRDVGTRRPRYSRPTPYARAPK